MIRSSLLVFTILVSAAGCGDNDKPIFDYSNPEGGALRLVNSKMKRTAETEVVLDLIVGDQPLTGYAVGFNLPVGHGLVRLDEFIPGKALDPGSSPPAAQARQPIDGPLADMLVTGIAQKATGTGAIATDTTLAPSSVLYTIRLQMVTSAPDGVVFDGTAADFRLPSGGMRDRGGTTVVEPTNVAIGKLEINR